MTDNCPHCQAREDEAIRNLRRDELSVGDMTAEEALTIIGVIGREPVADSAVLRMFVARLRGMRGLRVAASELLGMYEEVAR